MNLTFANPLGFWALLGIPAILLIHFLQTKSRQIRVSTLFLLDPLMKESVGGRRVERIRNSVPLWLQLLAVVLLAWLLSGPRWIRNDSTQSIVVVLDSSIAMRAFQPQLEKTLPARLRQVSKAAARTDWVVMESDLTRPSVYSGGNIDELEEALKKWKPSMGSHDPLPALRLGQSQVRQHGLLIFVTYHKMEVPPGTELIAVGSPTSNCGFAGFRFEEDKNTWHALVKNYGDTAQERNWWVQTGDKKTPPEKITLQPGQILALKGTFPSGIRACVLKMDEDAFNVDDSLPMVLPQPKRLRIYKPNASPLADFYTQLVDSVREVDTVAEGDKPDLELAVYDPLQPKLPTGAAIVFPKEPMEQEKYLEGPVIAEHDPLVENLNWQGLLCKETLGISKQEGDRVLLWQGDRPMIMVRGGARPQLLFNFDLDQSNAARLPAFVILLHRFIESVRDEKIAPESANVDTNQALRLSIQPAGKPLLVHADDGSPDLSLPTSQAQTLHAPVTPGFFEVRQGPVMLMTGAAHFADSRQSDLRDAASEDTVQPISALAGKNSRADFLAPVWMLVAAGLMVLNWAWAARRRTA